jgi:PAS domain S-box-containing protein
MHELLEILRQFGGGGDPGNDAVRFLLAAFFWLGLCLVSLGQYRRIKDRRDLLIFAAAAIGLARETVMFLLEYGVHRGWLTPVVSFRVFPPLEHALTDLGRLFLGFAYLRYFLRESRLPGLLLRVGVPVFVGLYLVTAPLWVRFLDARALLYQEQTARFGLFWGDLAFRVCASLLLGAVLLALTLARRRGEPVPAALFAGFFLLYLDEFLMIFNLTTGDGPWRETLAPIRHNLGIWAIPLFIWAYYGELLRQLRSSEADTERARAALTESEECYRTLVENIDHGITLLDERHRVLTANAAHARLLKKNPGEVVGQECYRAFHGLDAPCPDCPGTVAMATRRKAVVEKRTTRPDGSELVVSIQAFPVLHADGTVRGFIELVENVTEKRKLQAERERLDARVRQAQKMESLGILAGGIAHDFNNLLMGILGNVDLALTKTVPESPARPFLQRIDTAAQRAADLTNQMLAYSGRGRFIVEPINLSRLVEEIGHLLATVVSKGATLRYDLAADLPPVEADATQLRQVVMNLITNASDAIGSGEGVISVSTGAVDADAAYLAGLWSPESLAAGRYVFVEVTDTGVGMDAETRARIFDPFFSTKQTGRGLGLAAALGIVRGHKGGIRVYSERGKGTTVKVLLPAAAGAALPAADVPTRAPAADGGPGRGLVLVVDDEETVRETTRIMLEESGFSVVSANDGVEAVELYRRRAGEIAAVLLDMTMPRMGGEGTFRELRRIDPGVAVILSSGFAEQEALNRFAGKGLAGFLQKPYRARELAASVRAAIERRGRGQPEGATEGS